MKTTQEKAVNAYGALNRMAQKPMNSFTAYKLFKLKKKEIFEQRKPCINGLVMRILCLLATIWRHFMPKLRGCSSKTTLEQESSIKKSVIPLTLVQHMLAVISVCFIAKV